MERLKASMHNTHMLKTLKNGESLKDWRSAIEKLTFLKKLKNNELQVGFQFRLSRAEKTEVISLQRVETIDEFPKLFRFL